MTTKSYGQYCPIAKALDVLGDRWTLLILRDLSFGPKRFTDLRESLNGIAPNLLVERLRALEEADMVERQELPPPAARTVYALTNEGRDVRPVLATLARFGSRRLPDPQGMEIAPRAGYAAAITAYFDPLAAQDWDEQYRFVIDGQTFEVRVAHGLLRQFDPQAEPDLVMEASAAVLMDVRQGRTKLADAITTGAISVVGAKKTLAHFRRTFALVDH